MSDENINIRIRLKEAAKFAVETRLVTHEVDELGKATGRAKREADGATVSYNLLQRTLKLLKPATWIAGFLLLGKALAAGGLGALALVAALAPLVGLLGTIPAFSVLAGQGFGVMALGLAGVTDAVGGLNDQIDPKKFATLSRPAQDFALHLDALKPRILDLQRSVQRGMLPGLTEGLDVAAPAIAQLQGPLAGTGREIGRFGAGLGRLVGSRGFLADLRSQAEFNNVQMRHLGGATLDLVSVFGDLIVTSRPLVAWLVLLVAGWAASAKHMTVAGRASGGLQKGFDTVQVTTGRVVRIVADLAVALWNLGSIAKRNLGDQLLVSLVRGADALRQWTESGAGVSTVTGYFEDAKPVVYALARLLGTTGRTLAGFGDGGAGLVGVIGMLDSTVRLVGWLAEAVGPSTVLYAFLAGKIIMMGVKAFFLFSNTMRAIAVATGMATAAGAAQLTVMEATQAAAIGMWAAITGPVGLAILAIAAITAAVLVLYHKWGWFHRAVDNTWGFIKDHWPLLLTILTGPFGLAVLAITKNFNTIKSTANTVVSWITNRFRQLFGFFGRAKDKITSLMPGNLLRQGASFITGRALGGIVRPGETETLVGERGPEIARFPAGTQIVPHTATLSAPRMAQVSRTGGAMTTQGRGPVHVHVHSTLKVDRKTLAKATNEAIADEKAGG